MARAFSSPAAVDAVSRDRVLYELPATRTLDDFRRGSISSSAPDQSRWVRGQAAGKDGGSRRQAVGAVPSRRRGTLTDHAVVAEMPADLSHDRGHRKETKSDRPRSQPRDGVDQSDARPPESGRRGFTTSLEPAGDVVRPAGRHVRRSCPMTWKSDDSASRPARSENM